MLRDLIIKDILLIEHLELDLSAGLNVLTGETGAGKSILLDCLGLALGWRGRADVVRQGAEQGEVTAIFELPDRHPARAVLEDSGFSAGSELILRRSAAPDGRKKAFINDRRASTEVLRTLSETLVELHGQQDDRGLLDPKSHRDLLDDFGGNAPALGETRAAWNNYRAAQKALEAARSEQEAAAKDAEFLAHSVNELETFAPQPGEDASLDAKRRLMQAAERIRTDVEKARAALSGEGAQGQISDALKWLDNAADATSDQLSGPLGALERALGEISDAERGIEDVLRELHFNPHELEETEERLFALRALARKHNVQPDALAEVAADMAEKHARLEAGDAHLGALEARVQAERDQFLSAAAQLRTKREAAARRLDKAMAQELAPLKLDRAIFETIVRDAEEGSTGTDEVYFQVATNPGAPSGPLAKIASGGELSRFLLALKVCLTERSAKTLIFDEIDRGVGGATADAVGRRLFDLGQKAQVLVVTHSPQVAAFGNQHWQVAKSISGNQTRTRVVSLNAAQRIDEIARMLAGDVITDEARSAAKVLLAS